jgi:hypothetical protein
VIFVTIELRHAPWLGWIRDLSAPDPSSILNLFGLLPWGTPEQGSIFFFFSLGVLPIFLGISMWMQQKLNPAPTDATQKMIFAWMPWVFMFMLGSFASGLVLYWIANNTITFIQQYIIMRSHGHKPDLFGNILSGFKRGTKPDKAPAGKPAGKAGGTAAAKAKTAETVGDDDATTTVAVADPDAPAADATATEPAAPVKPVAARAAPAKTAVAKAGTRSARSTARRGANSGTKPKTK